MSTRQDKLEDTVRSVFVNRSATCLHRQLMDEIIKGLSSSILFMYTYSIFRKKYFVIIF